MSASAMDKSGKKRGAVEVMRKGRASARAGASPAVRSLPYAAPLGAAIGLAVIGGAHGGEPADEGLEPAELYGDFA